jgi:hypothetical protein
MTFQRNQAVIQQENKANPDTLLLIIYLVIFHIPC